MFTSIGKGVLTCHRDTTSANEGGTTVALSQITVVHTGNDLICATATPAKESRKNIPANWAVIATASGKTPVTTSAAAKIMGVRVMDVVAAKIMVAEVARVIGAAVGKTSTTNAAAMAIRSAAPVLSVATTNRAI